MHVGVDIGRTLTDLLLCLPDGERELGKRVARYGREATRAHIAELIEYAERVTRAELARWPPLPRISAETFADAPGNAVFMLPDTGPFLYVTLPDGRYTVSAEVDGVRKTQQVRSPATEARAASSTGTREDRCTIPG